MRNDLQEDHLTVKLQGSAGQSLGAFAAPGLKIEVAGDANDYVGKGLSGGTIVVRPLRASPIVAEDNTIIGNTVLYGATAGKLFANGRAGERLVESHLAETGSPKVDAMLRDWSKTLAEFVQICPKEMVDRLEHPLSDKAAKVPAE